MSQKQEDHSNDTAGPFKTPSKGKTPLENRGHIIARETLGRATSQDHVAQSEQRSPAWQTPLPQLPHQDPIGTSNNSTRLPPDESIARTPAHTFVATLPQISDTLAKMRDKSKKASTPVEGTDASCSSHGRFPSQNGDSAKAHPELTTKQKGKRKAYSPPPTLPAVKKLRASGSASDGIQESDSGNDIGAGRQSGYAPTGYPSHAYPMGNALLSLPNMISRRNRQTHASAPSTTYSGAVSPSLLPAGQMGSGPPLYPMKGMGRAMGSTTGTPNANAGSARNDTSSRSKVASKRGREETDISSQSSSKRQRYTHPSPQDPGAMGATINERQGSRSVQARRGVPVQSSTPTRHHNGHADPRTLSSKEKAMEPLSARQATGTGRTRNTHARVASQPSPSTMNATSPIAYTQSRPLPARQAAGTGRTRNTHARVTSEPYPSIMNPTSPIAYPTRSPTVSPRTRVPPTPPSLRMGFSQLLASSDSPTDCLDIRQETDSLGHVPSVQETQVGPQVEFQTSTTSSAVPGQHEAHSDGHPSYDNLLGPLAAPPSFVITPASPSSTALPSHENSGLFGFSDPNYPLGTSYAEVPPDVYQSGWPYASDDQQNTEATQNQYYCVEGTLDVVPASDAYGALNSGASMMSSLALPLSSGSESVVLPSVASSPYNYGTVILDGSGSVSDAAFDSQETAVPFEADNRDFGETMGLGQDLGLSQVHHSAAMGLPSTTSASQLPGTVVCAYDGPTSWTFGTVTPPPGLPSSASSAEPGEELEAHDQTATPHIPADGLEEASGSAASSSGSVVDYTFDLDGQPSRW